MKAMNEYLDKLKIVYSTKTDADRKRMSDASAAKRRRKAYELKIRCMM